MSLFGALSASLTALSSQSRAVNVISNNIANLSTTGFKSTSVSFSTLIAGTIGGGVIDSLRQDISSQGAVNSTGIGTDLAIQGQGFFVVKDGSGNFRYTRAGSFRTDSGGNLVNEAGFQLQGWRLINGNLPGENGDTRTSFSNLNSLETVSEASISGQAAPTSKLTVSMNLKAEEDILGGSGGVLTPQSSTNENNSSTQIIVPQATMAFGNTITITNATNASTYTYGGIEPSTDVTVGAGVAGATSAGATFTGFTDGQNFTITADGVTSTFTFQTASDTSLGQFKNLNELSQIIDNTEGLRSRVVGGILYVAPDDANDALDFTDVSGTIAASLGLADTSSSTLRFASLDDLATMINDATGDGLTATLGTPTSSATLSINNIDSTDTITFTDSNAADDLLDEMGLNSTAIAATYDATDPDRNISGGNISPDFSRTITVFDSLGRSLNLTLAFVRLANTEADQTWGVELYSPDRKDAITLGSAYDNGSGANAGGLVGYGTISFNGDGTLKSVAGPIATTLAVHPLGSIAQDIDLSLGTAGDVGIGEADGMSQFGGNYSVSAFTQDGFPTGSLQSLQIDSQGFVTAIFDNSLTSQVFRLPLAFFSNPNGLTAEQGNSYSDNINAGNVNLGRIGTDSGVGTMVPNALEVSTAEIGNELTKLIVSQQSYSASANVLRKVGELFDELKQL